VTKRPIEAGKARTTAQSKIKRNSSVEQIAQENGDFPAFLSPFIEKSFARRLNCPGH
jgi:hypothetical protein